jgi:hypothetical protein
MMAKEFAEPVKANLSTESLVALQPAVPSFRAR